MAEQFCPTIEEIKTLLEVRRGEGERLHDCFIWMAPAPLTYLKLLSKINAGGEIEARAILMYPNRIQSVYMTWEKLSKIEFGRLARRISAWEARVGKGIDYWIKKASKYHAKHKLNEMMIE